MWPVVGCRAQGRPSPARSVCCATVRYVRARHVRSVVAKGAVRYRTRADCGERRLGFLSYPSHAAHQFAGIPPTSQVLEPTGTSPCRAHTLPPPLADAGVRSERGPAQALGPAAPDAPVVHGAECGGWLAHRRPSGAGHHMPGDGVGGRRRPACGHMRSLLLQGAPRGGACHQGQAVRRPWGPGGWVDMRAVGVVVGWDSDPAGQQSHRLRACS